VRTMAAMSSASTRSPSAAEIPLAPSRISTSGFAKRSMICRPAENRRTATASFGPCASSRRAASADVRPGSLSKEESSPDSVLRQAAGVLAMSFG
jgi:hypothetical protein